MAEDRRARAGENQRGENQHFMGRRRVGAVSLAKYLPKDHGQRALLAAFLGRAGSSPGRLRRAPGRR